MAKLSQFLEAGQSIWLDDIRRDYFSSGELARLVQLGLRGLTSNPSIFEKAIRGSQEYDEELRELVRQRKTLPETYEALVIADIRQAADILLPVYESSGGRDGFVSLEVSPRLAYDSEKTASDAIRLFKMVDRANLMVKIPATNEGLPAIQEALRSGVNINVTLIFSIKQYEAVIEAHMRGLEERLKAGGEIGRIASVASFFVSRVDTMLDPLLKAAGAGALEGKIAIANSRAAYSRFCEMYGSERWMQLAARGAQVQRPLWASTSTKNPAYPDTYYVEALVGTQTVNTLPPITLEAILDHGKARSSLESGIPESLHQLNQLHEIGIDLDGVTQKLEDEGVAAFAKSFDSLMDGLERKYEFMRAEELSLSVRLGKTQAKVNRALAEIDQDEIISRIWKGDHTVWNPDPSEITNRLGWLQTAEVMLDQVTWIEQLVSDVRGAGYTHALLLGMGGSSLAPEVFRKCFGVKPGYLDLSVLDSTDPAAVLEAARRLNPAKTLYLVSTKSGGTVETASFMEFFYNLAAESLGVEQVGAHFVAITDPGSEIAKIAESFKFRTILLNDPNIGGRFSGLSLFGLAPAGLIGIDLRKLLLRAVGMAAVCAKTPAVENLGVYLGAIIGELARQGRDKLTLISSTELRTFGDWLEQLIAESSGKSGIGILPVVGEVTGNPDSYAADRAFVYLRLAGDHDQDNLVKALEQAEFPVIGITIEDTYDLGGQIFLWEFATAVACQRLGVQPFDQPDVESAKILARKMVASFQESGQLPEPAANLRKNGIQVFGPMQSKDLPGCWDEFLSQAQPGGYLAVLSYIPPSTASDASLLALRTELRERTKLAVTTGYGPRFLHSTGQLHKGDAGRGLFIQITCEALEDAAIPEKLGEAESRISFGVLERAQALGDSQALLDRGRKVIRFHIEDDLQIGLRRLIQSV